MENSNNNMTAERSLEIITETIEQSRRDITRGSWKSMMVWGVAVTLVALTVGHLWAHSTLGPTATWLWVLLGVVPLIERMLIKKQPKRPQTFVSKTLNQIWSSFGIMAGLLGAVCGVLFATKATPPLSATYQSAGVQIVWFPITAIIIWSMGIAGMITGRILNSRPITVCCFIAGLFCILPAIFCPGPLEMVAMALASIIGLIIPALILKSKEG